MSWPLGATVLGVDLLGGESSEPADGASTLLGDFGMGWGMLGGDGDEGTAPPAGGDTDHTLLITGNAFISGIPVTNTVTLEGDVYATVPTWVDCIFALSGDLSVAHVPTTRTITLHGDSSLHAFVEIDSTVSLHGDASLHLPVDVDRTITLHGGVGVFRFVERSATLSGDGAASITRFYSVEITIPVGPMKDSPQADAPTPVASKTTFYT